MEDPRAQPHPELPAELRDSIRAGRCVAFVGSGFSQPTTPGWKELLAQLVEEMPTGEQQAELEQWLAEAPLTNRDFEGIAQGIEEGLGDGFRPALKRVLSRELHAETRERRKLLYGTPFHLILTTNFDSVLDPAAVADEDSDAFAAALNAPVRPWWSGDWWAASGPAAPARARVIKLHGDMNRSRHGVVFTTRGYRRRIHEKTVYRSFLRAIFATNTVLYMGFSFTDAYINELRSEVLSMRDLGRNRREGSDYAILADVPERLRRHLADHEGLVALPFETTEDGAGRDFSGFTHWLRQIHRETNPGATLRARLRATRILWLDPHPRNNDYGYRVLTKDAEGRSNPLVIEQVESLEDAVGRLRAENHGESGSGYDLVLTHWGHDAGPEPNGSALLRTMREEDLRAPVLIFGSDGPYTRHNRNLALRLGALGFTSSWPELFMALDRFVTEAGPSSR